VLLAQTILRRNDLGLEQNTLHDSDMVWRDGFGYERHLGQDLATCSAFRQLRMKKAILSHYFLLARIWGLFPRNQTENMNK
jgi:hypothetical protein